MYTSNKGQDDFQIVFMSTNGHPVFKKLKKVFTRISNYTQQDKKAKANKNSISIRVMV